MTNEGIIKDCDRAIALMKKIKAEVSGEKKANYIDLGLPSGTLWAETNEEGFYSFDEAVEKFGKALPGITQLAELREFCEWNWDDEKKGYKVTGKNGNSIFLPAAGCRIDNCICESGEFGHLWSSTANPSISDSISFAHSLHFGDSGINLSGFDDCLNGRSVRLVKPSCWETKEPIPDKFSGLKSLMQQYLQSAANRKDDAEIESDTDLWGRKILDYVWKCEDEKQKELM